MREPDQIRVWEDPASGATTIEVVDNFGEVKERHVVTEEGMHVLRTSGTRILRTDEVLKDLRSGKLPRTMVTSTFKKPPSFTTPSGVTVRTTTPPAGGKTMAETKAERPKRSCIDCPNFMSADQVGRRYGKSIGTPMCKAFDKPIGRASFNLDEMRTAATKVGTACDQFGKDKTETPARSFKVAFPDVRLMAAPVDENLKRPVTSCTMCRNFSPDDVVMSELGWVAGMCNAKGELIQPHSTTFVGRTCDIRQFGPTRQSAMTGLNLFPEYTEDFVTPDLIGAFKAAGAFDPVTHETDKPVDAEDQRLGIRAWKLIRDKARPEYDTGVYLPIFDPDFFDDKEQAKIPQSGEDAHPELYLDHANAVYRAAVLWQHLDETPAVWGEPGNGKTELFRHLAWMMQLPFERISITASSELDDLAGKMHYKEGEGTIFKYGRVPQAWSKPSVLCIDEPNVGPPDVWQFFRPLTDNSKQLVLDMNEGEAIPRHDSCYLGMALNPAWDPRNVGAAPIGDADQRRLMHIWMPAPPEKVEEEIIVQRCSIDGYKIPRVVLKAIMSTAKELRGMSEQGAIPVSWGVASQIKVARATRWFTLLDAYKIAVTDFLEPSQAQTVLDSVRANAPDTLINTGGGGGGGTPAPW